MPDASANSRAGLRPATRVLSRRAVNRATLARQFLLERADRQDVGVMDLIHHLGGLQAQTPHTWYVGFWTRIKDFQPEWVSALLERREIVRIALMRSTIHLVTASDCLTWRPLLAPVLERSMSGNFGKNLVGIDRAGLTEAGRAVLEERPMLFSELGRALARRWPDRDPASLAQAIRAWLPLVQVTPRGLWGRSGRAAHTTAESWLGRPLKATATVDEIVLRYLGAFGPASVADMQVWSGLTRLAEVTDRLRRRLVTYRDETGRELFDLPGAPLPDADTPAPVRFLYDYDNLLLSHSDRSRVITEDYFRQEFRMDGPMPRAILVDGVTSGSWTTEINRDAATITIAPFRPLGDRDTTEVTQEGADLLAFLAPRGLKRDVRIMATQ